VFFSPRRTGGTSTPTDELVGPVNGDPELLRGKRPLFTATAHLYVELELPGGAADGELIQHPVCGAHQTIGLAHRGVRAGKLVKWRPSDRESDYGLDGSEFGHEPPQCF